MNLNKHIKDLEGTYKTHINSQNALIDKLEEKLKEKVDDLQK